MTVEHSIIGKSYPKIDAPEKSTGRAEYTADLVFTGMLFGKMLLSPLPHARVLHIDTSRAERLAGVQAVITGRDVSSVLYGVSPARYDENVLALDKVRYVGDETAAVVAVDEETAVEAISLIKVDYQPLEAVFDPFQAMKEGAPQIHERAKNNINAEVHQEFGELEKAFRESDYVRQDRFVTQRAAHAPMEPHAVVACFDSSGKLTVWSSTQVPHYVHYQLSRVLGLPMGMIRVIKPYLGGGFGGKAETTCLEFCSAILSQKTGRPVQMIYDRKEMFLHGRGRHRQFIELKTGVKKDGQLKGLQVNVVMEGGAYTSFGIATIYYAGAMLSSPYRLPTMKFDGYLVYTNQPTCGAQRGHGTPQTRFAFESQLDMIAEELGIDPLEIRLLNAVGPNEMTINELKITSCEFSQCLKKVAEISDWKKKKGKLPPGRGIGLAGAWYLCGAAYPIYRSEMPHSNAMIKLGEDGTSATLYVGAADIGQGSDTVLAQIAAEELGLAYEDIRVLSADTELTPLDLGAYASRQTFMSGNAVRQAAADVKRQLLQLAAQKLEANVDDLLSRESKIFVKGAPDRFLPFAEVAEEAFFMKGPVVGKGSYKPPKLGGAFKGGAVGTSPAYSFVAQVAEVSVDVRTGQITVDRIYNVHDSGTVINPRAFHGQAHGSVHMGLGEAIYEEVVIENGVVVNPTLAEYRIPTANDMPEIQSEAVASYDPAGPFGAKEVGEGSILPVVGAIANAVYNACGVRIKKLPMTPEQVFMALKAK
ncbi:MAG: 4-hydroxybenzoyl-CoA reductase subunit alpha [Thermodesulfobacteriota bacterium]